MGYVRKLEIDFYQIAQNVEKEKLQKSNELYFVVTESDKKPIKKLNQ
jgi:hypothetical protein